MLFLSLLYFNPAGEYHSSRCGDLYSSENLFYWSNTMTVLTETTLKKCLTQDKLTHELSQFIETEQCWGMSL
jgi:hypothetical protein